MGVRSTIATVLLASSAHAAVAQMDADAMHRSSVQQSQQVGVVVHSSTIDRTQWELTDADWHRYDEIMKGPRRFWSPGVDPLTVLGAEARNDAERQRYAEMLVAQERKRTEGELALARAYTEAWLRMYGNEPLVDMERLGIEQVIPFDVTDRIAIFLDTRCVACTNIIQGITGYLHTSPWPGLDLYFVGDEEEAIQNWTSAAGVPFDLVNTGRITINFEDGILAQLQETDSPSYPSAYRRRGNEFSPVEMSYLLRADLYAGQGGAKPGDSSSKLWDWIKGFGQ